MEKTPALEQRLTDLGAAWRSWLGWRVAAHYGDPGCEYEHVVRAAGVADATYRGCLTASGRDVTGFLDGVVSSVASSLGIDFGQRSTLLTARGRLVGDFRLFRTGEEECLLLFDGPLPAEFQASLQKYAFLDDIAVQDDSVSHALLGVEGRQSAEVLQDALGLPALRDPNRRVKGAWKGASIEAYPGGESPDGGAVLRVPVELLEGVWDTLLDAAARRGGGAVGRDALEVLRVEAGQPRFGLDYDGTNFPNEAGLENALDYSKCYVGQEVVARMRTYGHANRRIVGLRFEGDPLPVFGAPLRSGEEGGEAGSLRSVALSPRCGPVGLAMVRRKHWACGTRLRVAAAGAELGAEVVDLPFLP